MRSSAITYNPGILGDGELISSFVVRQHSLELILETLRENAGSRGSNRHLLIIGPRGIGKTMLVRRAAAEVRRNSAYGSQWHPLVFGEESYSVSTAGEFWLEALFHLADQTGETRWRKTVAELRDESDEARLRERALAQLLNFADETSKRLLLVVENLNILLGEQTPSGAGWDLRHALASEQRLMLLGTAVRRFEEITHIDRAWFEMFAIHELKPLTHDECQLIWTSATENPLPQGPLRAIRILTGGNPRLLRIIAGFAVNHSFRELMDQLVHLIDDHTDYFKSHLDSLPALERKVFVALLEHWDPATASELARATRLHVSKASALLGRLQGRGAVEVIEQKPRRRLYQVVERLYNIYYLMRRRGHPSGRVHAAVDFMVTFYEGQELTSRIAELAREACGLPEGTRTDHYLAYNDVLRRVWRHRQDILKCTPPEFFEAPDAPAFIRMLPQASGHQQRRRSPLLREARSLERSGRLQEAGDLYRRAVNETPADAQAWIDFGLLLAKLDRFTEAEEAFRKAVELNPRTADVWSHLGIALFIQDQFSDAEDALRKAIEIDPGEFAAWHFLAQTLQRLRRYGEAEEAFRRAIGLQPDVALTWVGLGDFLLEQDRLGDAEQAFRKAIELRPADAFPWAGLGRTLGRSGRLQEAEQVCHKATELASDLCIGWVPLARVLEDQGRFEEAEHAIRKAIEVHSEAAAHWRVLGRVLKGLGRFDEAEKAIRRAIELGPEDADNWNHLGLILDTPGRTEEAAEAVRKAIEIDPGRAGYWSNLGHLLLKHGPPAEAEEVWQKALEVHSELLGCAGHLLQLRLNRGVDEDSILREARGWVERARDDADVLRAMASFIVQLNLRGGLADAEAWARRAFSRDPSWKNAVVLADVLAAEQKWEEALETFGTVLSASADEEKARAKSIDFLIGAAASGYVSVAVKKLASSSGASALEPLLVGLRIYMGEMPAVAKEILEIAQDVAERIRKKRGSKSTLQTN